MDTYHIRPATPQDLEVVLTHRRRMFEDMGFTERQALDTMIAVSTPLIRRGLMDGTDVRPQRAWVVNMFTDPEHRRRGLARRLVQTIVEWCRKEGMRFLYLHASDDGRPLYESMGFKSTNEMRLVL